MIDAMWIWGALGLALLAAEMATGTIYMLWFGISALCLAIAVWIFPGMHQALQLVIFAVLSITSLAIWKLNYKKNDEVYRVGQAQGEEIGRTGIVIDSSGPNHIGKIQFTQGLMGSREWAAVSSEIIETGSEAKVIAVEGNTLRISKN
ncbi:MAG: NfeD family protein [Methylophilus sp.]